MIEFFHHLKSSYNKKDKEQPSDLTLPLYLYMVRHGRIRLSELTLPLYLYMMGNARVPPPLYLYMMGQEIREIYCSKGAPQSLR